MDLLNSLKAKDKKSEDFLLKDHIAGTLKRLEQFYEYIKLNESFITFEELKDKTKRNELFKSLAKALLLHDLGKIDYHFQEKIYRKDSELNSEEWKRLKVFFSNLKENKSINIRHEILSIIWSIFLLKNSDKKARTAVLLHHYNNYFINIERDLMEIIIDYEKPFKAYLEFIKNNETEILDFLDSLITELDQKIENEIIKTALQEVKQNIDVAKCEELLDGMEAHQNDLSDYAEFYNFQNNNYEKQNKTTSQQNYFEFLFFLGVLRRCDYSASGEVNIEEISSSMQEFYIDLENRISKKILKNPFWQKELLDNTKEKNLVLVAPTGSGKTEFALMWAEKNARKLIYTLPLRVALNDIYIRFTENKDDKEENKGYFFDKKDNVGLLHSTSFIEYLKDQKETTTDNGLTVDEKLTSSSLISNTVILSTPDQILLTSLNFYGCDKVMSVYPTACVVIDEIQTYTPEMSAIIIKTLKLINALKGKILVITATLPPYFIKYFNDIEIVNDLKIIDLREDEYKDIRKDIKNYKKTRHKIGVVNKSIFNETVEEEKLVVNYSDFTEIWNTIKEKDNKNILIIVNTVKKAIGLYGSDVFKNQNPILLHSRLIEKEKSDRVKKIKQNLEKNRKGTIVISTQLIEASVDIDFDLMITEISSIDSQIQRWGRIFRNRENEVYSGEAPNIIIFTNRDKSTNYIYDQILLEKTVEVLEKNQNIILDYEKERQLIDDVFDIKIEDKENLKLSKVFENEIDKNLKNLDYISVEKKSEAQRLFRRLAGTQIVIPDLILEDFKDDEKRIKFANIIKDKNKKDISWKEILKEIGLENNNNWILKLRGLLYDYSTNFPVFFEKHKWRLVSHEFKGFYIMKDDKEILKEVREKGLDKAVEDVKLISIDDQEINEFASRFV